MKRILMAVVTACVAAFSALAENYYLSVSDNGNNKYNEFLDYTKWVDSTGAAATAWDTTATYVVSNCVPPGTAASARVMVTPNSRDTQVFPGGPLVLISPTSSHTAALYLYVTSDDNTAEVKIPGGLTMGDYSRLYAGNGTHQKPNILDADIVTIWGDSGQRGIIQAGDSGRGLVLKGKLTGTKGSSSQIQFSPGKKDYSKFDVSLLGDLSEFNGCFDILGFHKDADLLKDPDIYSMKLTFGNGTCPGTFYLHQSDNTTNGLAIVFAVDKPDSVFQIKNFGKIHNDKAYGEADRKNRAFGLQSGMAFEFPVDGEKGQCGQFVVYNSLLHDYNCLAAATNVAIRLVGDPSKHDGVTTNKFATFSVPKATPLVAERFRLDFDHKNYPWVKGATLSVETGDTYSTIYVTVPPADPFVTLVKSDGVSHAGNSTKAEDSAWSNAASWSNNELPSSDYDYYVLGTGSKMGIRGPGSASWSYEFPGKSLTLSGDVRIQTQGSSFTASNMKVIDGYDGGGNNGSCGFYMILNSASISHFCGNLTVESGAFRFGTWKSWKLYVDSELHGSGTVMYSGMWLSDDALGYYYPTALNTDFFGKVILSQPYREKRGDDPLYVSPRWDADYSALCLSYGRNLGGTLAEMTPDALTIKDFGRLQAAASFTIAKESNRGVTVDGNGIFDPAAGKTIVIETPLAVKGNAYKDGAGTLVLAGAATAVSGADTLAVSNGVLALAAEKALSGLAVALGPNTSLAVRPGFAGTKGVDLTDVALTLDVSFGGKLPLVTEADYRTRELAADVYEVPVFTVSTGDKATFQAMLPAVPPKFFKGSHSVWLTPVDNGDGTTTFSAEIVRGFIFLVR